jgi:circadian clock protein KaiC
MHLAVIHKLVDEFQPQVIIIDPISNFLQAGSLSETQMMLMRLVDFLKARELTTCMTNLISGGIQLEQKDEGISSLIDTWLLIRDIEEDGARRRGFFVLKSRGMAHSDRIHAMSLSAKGVDIADSPQARATGIDARPSTRPKGAKVGRRHPPGRSAAKQSVLPAVPRVRRSKRAGGRKK